MAPKGKIPQEIDSVISIWYYLMSAREIASKNLAQLLQDVPENHGKSRERLIKGRTQL
jgi:hypothetical protein